MSAQTTAGDVRATFLTTPEAQEAYEDWRQDSRRCRVVPVVERHTTRVLYELTPHDVERTCTNSEHPLRRVDKSRVSKLGAVQDWNPDFAFTHLLYFQMEEQEVLPTWQEFRGFIFDNETGYDMLGRQAIDFRNALTRRGVARDLADEALRWRVGLAYYGILRDIYTLVEVRAQGIDVQAHPLADALLRVDAWVGHVVLNMRVNNSKFRDNKGGRKKSTEELLRNANPPFHVEPVALPKASTFGEVHLPKGVDIANLAEKLRGFFATVNNASW